MEALAETQSVYRRAFEAQEQGHRPWLAALHRRGIEAFETRGLPGPKQEPWRKTPLAPLTEQVFPVAEGAGTVPPALARRAVALGESARLVFVDGVLDPGLSDVGEPGQGLTVAPLSEYGDAAPAALTERLGSGAPIHDQPFAALNTAFFRDGVLPLDVALLQVSPPDKHGYCSLGVSVDASISYSTSPSCSCS